MSTADQEEKFGLAAQLYELRGYAGKMGYDVAGEYQDAISGESDTRPSLDRLIGEAKAGEVVLLHHPDRLSRGGVGPQFLIERELHRHGAVVDSMAIPRSSQDESAWKLQKEILGSIAAYERAQIKARTTRVTRRRGRGRSSLGPRPTGTGCRATSTWSRRARRRRCARCTSC